MLSLALSSIIAVAAFNPLQFAEHKSILLQRWNQARLHQSCTLQCPGPCNVTIWNQKMPNPSAITQRAARVSSIPGTRGKNRVLTRSYRKWHGELHSSIHVGRITHESDSRLFIQVEDHWQMEGSRCNAPHSPRTRRIVPQDSRDASAASYMARTRMLLRRVPERPTSPLRPSLYIPLLSLLLHGSETLHRATVPDQGHAVH